VENTETQTSDNQNVGPMTSQDQNEKNDVETNEEANATESSAMTESEDSELIELKQTLGKLEDENLRLRADMQNMLRRHQKEKADATKFANEKLMNAILPVLDSFDKASDASDDDHEGFKKGVLLVRDQLIDSLKHHGLEGFVSQGAEFDPERHQGIQRIEDESVDSETVKDEYQKGYVLNGRLLRPAMVSVLVPKK
jgi:molecular chaperone GrpE